MNKELAPTNSFLRPILARLSIFLVVASMVSGCVTPAAENPENVSLPEPEPTIELTDLEQGCLDFENGAITHPYLENYSKIITDICSNTILNYELVEVRASPKSNPGDVQYLLESQVFGLSYWDRYLADGITKHYLVIQNETEQDFWQAQMTELLKIEPTWFDLSDKGGHCYAVEPDAFCMKLYVGNEGDTKGDYDVVVIMLGSRVDWNPSRRVGTIHEATHGFHTAARLGHWRYWFVEGQATYFEMAASVLLPNLRSFNWRREQLVSFHGSDEHKFTASTPEEAYQHLLDCDSGKRCEGFRYLAASFAHELLVNEYGAEKYLAWNLDLADQLPDFAWDGKWKSSNEQQNGVKLFEKIFKDHFGIEITKWEREVFSPYVLENYKL